MLRGEQYLAQAQAIRKRLESISAEWTDEELFANKSLCKRFTPGLEVQPQERVSYDSGLIYRYIGEEPVIMSWQEIPSTSALYETIDLNAVDFVENETVVNEGDYVFSEGKFFKSLTSDNSEAPSAESDNWEQLTKV